MLSVNIEEFRKDIQNIREYINNIQLIKKLNLDSFEENDQSLKDYNEHRKKFRTEIKIFEYKAIIISLYGILEKNIETWIKTHISGLPNLIPNYTDLPENLQKSNLELSIKLIAILQEGKQAKFNHLSIPDVVSNLNNSLTTPTHYAINSDAFVIASGNLKHSQIVKMFSPFDITLEKALKNHISFKTYLQTRFQTRFQTKIDSIASEFLYEKIDDLVRRRNEVSHGGHIDDILDINEFEDYIDFLKHYCETIYEIIIQQELMYESKHKYEEIETVINVFGHGSVLAFTLVNDKLKKGEFILVKTPENVFLKKQILEIQINKQTYPEIEVVDPTDVAINLGSGITMQQHFYKIKKD